MKKTKKKKDDRKNIIFKLTKKEKNDFSEHIGDLNYQKAMMQLVRMVIRGEVKLGI